MRPIGPGLTLAAIIAISAATAHAQRTYEPAVPRTLPQQQGIAPARELAPPATAAQSAPPMQLNMNAERAARDRDVRHCLSLPTNREVHRCAHPYSPRARAAAAKRRAKAAAKAPPKAPVARAPAPAVTAKAPEALKPGAARLDEKAKAAELVRPMDVTRPAAVPKPVGTAKAAAEPAKK